jgi:hypothetical protein
MGPLRLQFRMSQVFEQPEQIADCGGVLEPASFVSYYNSKINRPAYENQPWFLIWRCSAALKAAPIPLFAFS